MWVRTFSMKLRVRGSRAPPKIVAGGRGRIGDADIANIVGGTAARLFALDGRKPGDR
jgi:hypothetical protein